MFCIIGPIDNFLKCSFRVGFLQNFHKIFQKFCAPLKFDYYREEKNIYHISMYIYHISIYLSYIYHISIYLSYIYISIIYLYIYHISIYLWATGSWRYFTLSGARYNLVPRASNSWPLRNANGISRAARKCWQFWV